MKGPDEVEKEALAIGEMLSVIDDIRREMANNTQEVMNVVNFWNWRFRLQQLRDSLVDLASERQHEEP